MDCWINKSWYSKYTTNIDRWATNPFEKNWRKKTQILQTSCHMIKHPICGTILCCKNKYAMVQGRYTGKWSFPKGHIKQGETLSDCALRELREETGINDITISSGKVEKLAVGVYFTININNQQELNPIDSNEIIDAGWFTIEELNMMSINIDVSLFIKRSNATTEYRKQYNKTCY